MKNNLEFKILEHLDDYGLDIFSVNQLLSMDEPHHMIRRSLSTLVKLGHIKKIEKGKYCRHNFSDEFVIGSFLVNEGAIGYWSAMNYHGLTEQIPNVVFVQTRQWKKNKTIFGVSYKFIQVKKTKLMGYKTEGYGNHQFAITDIEKTIVDCFDRPEYSGGYPEIIKAFSHADLNPRKLVKYCKATGNISLTKRLGYLSELLSKPDMGFFMDYAMSVRNERYTPLVPGLQQKGKTNRKWHIIVNIDEKEILNIAND